MQEQEVPWAQLDRGAGSGALEEALELWNALSPAERNESAAAREEENEGRRRSARLRRGTGAGDVSRGAVCDLESSEDNEDSSCSSGSDESSENDEN